MRLAAAVTMCAAAAACAASRTSLLGEPLPGGLDVRFTEETYRFSALTPGQVADAMRDFGPELGPHRVPAATRQDLTWDYRVRRRGLACELQGATVRLEITMMLPSWSNRRRAPEPWRDRWNAFADAVRRHEEGHVRLYIAGARDLLRRLGDVGAGPCATVRDVADGIGRASIERFAERNATYDRDTQGGRTQGVCWPGFHDDCA